MLALRVAHVSRRLFKIYHNHNRFAQPGGPGTYLVDTTLSASPRLACRSRPTSGQVHEVPERAASDGLDVNCVCMKCKVEPASSANDFARGTLSEHSLGMCARARGSQRTTDRVQCVGPGNSAVKGDAVAFRSEAYSLRVRHSPREMIGP